MNARMATTLLIFVMAVTPIVSTGIAAERYSPVSGGSEFHPLIAPASSIGSAVSPLSDGSADYPELTYRRRGNWVDGIITGARHGSLVEAVLRGLFTPSVCS